MNTPNYLTEFPSFVLGCAPEQAGFEIDTSWHNNTCPSFATVDEQYTLYVDFINPDHRDYDEALRFSIYENTAGYPDDNPVLHSNNWNDVLAYMAQRTKGK